ncbi:platelet glycoprotein VI-like isoform X2 [Macrotis lagotis]|uniref:platelet glycoprotein VI-like isoform X2 n=1 Tax=Macrotis lagotis TaxID=92651 RepID=UPI003D68D382
MGPSLAALLCLRFHVVQALEDYYLLPAPRFEAEPQDPVPLGEPLLLRCLGAYDSFNYRLVKEAAQEPPALNASSLDSMSPVFRYPRAGPGQAGRFRCLYNFHTFWSRPSAPLDVVVADFYEKPFLWATPSLSASMDKDVTFHCNSAVGLDKFVLYHGTPEQGFKTIQPQSIKKNEAVIPLHNRTKEMNGEYRCYGYMSSEPHYWSAASDILVLDGVGHPPGHFNTIHLTHVLVVMLGLGILLT